MLNDENLKWSLATALSSLSSAGGDKTRSCIFNFERQKNTVRRESAVDFINRTSARSAGKTKDRYFEFTLRRKKRANWFVQRYSRGLVKTSRCRNVIYDGVHGGNFTLQLVRGYNAAGPAERAQWTLKMRKQLSMQPPRARRFRRLRVSLVTSPASESLAQENGLEAFDLGISRASSIWRLFQRAWLLRSNNSRVDAENNSRERGSRETSSCISYD